MSNEPLEDRVGRLLLQYAGAGGVAQPLDPALLLGNDLGVESLSLVSVAVRLGEELGVDIVEQGAELGDLRTVGDVIALARELASRNG